MQSFGIYISLWAIRKNSRGNPDTRKQMHYNRELWVDNKYFVNGNKNESSKDNLGEPEL